jgi:hypothetical protein
MRHLPAVLVLLGLLGTAWAQENLDPRLAALEQELTRVRQEQQAVYQQFQILQALQRNEGLEADPTSALYAPEGSIPNYDDMVRARQERQERIRYYSDEMRRLSERHQVLEERAGPLLDEIRARAAQPERR